eukprot:COSAG02_NODE_6480_length_3547_cov_3.628770_2_plen_55_part_00
MFCPGVFGLICPFHGFAPLLPKAGSSVGRSVRMSVRLVRVMKRSISEGGLCFPR